jgi:hypothetical protein
MSETVTPGSLESRARQDRRATSALWSRPSVGRRSRWWRRRPGGGSRWSTSGRSTWRRARSTPPCSTRAGIVFRADDVSRPGRAHRSAGAARAAPASHLCRPGVAGPPAQRAETLSYGHTDGISRCLAPCQNRTNVRRGVGRGLARRRPSPLAQEKAPDYSSLMHGRRRLFMMAMGMSPPTRRAAH